MNGCTRTERFFSHEGLTGVRNVKIANKGRGMNEERKVERMCESDGVGESVGKIIGGSTEVREVFTIEKSWSVAQQQGNSDYEYIYRNARLSYM